MKETEILEILKLQTKAYLQAQVNTAQAQGNHEERLAFDYFPSLPIPQEVKDQRKRRVIHFLDLQEQLEKVSTYEGLFDFLTNHCEMQPRSLFHFILSNLTTEWEEKPDEDT